MAPERRSSLVSRFENACGLAIVPALVASPEACFDDDAPGVSSSSHLPDGTRTATERRGTPHTNLHCVALERPSQIAVKDDEIIQSPQSPALASRPRKFQLEEDEQMKQARIKVLDGGAGRIMTSRSSSCGASPSQTLPVVGQPECETTPSRLLPIIQLSRSLPSPAVLSCSVDCFKETLEDEEILSRTPPDRILSYSHGAPPTPRAPKKSYEIRSAPLGNKQPRRLQFGIMDGFNSPENSCPSNDPAESGTLGVASKSHHSLECSDKDDGRRGVELLQSAYDVEKPGALQTVDGFPPEHPQTPPDKMFNSFARSTTPTAPKKLLRGSKSDREGPS